MANKYDIFISYRRDGGTEHARILQLLLSQHGYNTFLDFDELHDGRFDDKIYEAIECAPVFLVLLSKDSMRRCANNNDWVCREIRHAIEHNKKIIPITINREFEGFPPNTPPDIVEALSPLQFSNIDTESLLNESVEKLIKERIANVVYPQRKRVRLYLALSAILLIVVSLFIFIPKRTIVGLVDNGKTIIDNLADSTTNSIGDTIATQPTNSIDADDGDTIFLKSYAPLDIRRKIAQTIADNMVDVEGGEFDMPLTYEKYDTITPKFHHENMKHFRIKPFKISRYEVTQEQWMAVMGKNPAKFIGAKHPVENVSYEECETFIAILNDLDTTQRVFRIPTEEEWAYAARGGNKSKGYEFSGSNDLSAIAWNTFNSNGHTHTVGLKEPNEIGLYDMCGNVFEWTKAIRKIPGDDNTYHIRRGGSWNCDQTCCRPTTRDFKEQNYKSEAIGLRVAE